MKNTKNKLILAFLLIPVVIGCQNTTVVQNSSSPKPGQSLNATTSSTEIPLIYPTSSGNIIVNNSSIFDLPVLNSEQPTPIIYSNMENIFQLENSQRYENRTFRVYGYVYDYKGNPIEKALIKIEGLFLDLKVYVSTITNNKGFYEAYSLSTTSNISAEKEGYSKRFILYRYHDSGIPSESGDLNLNKAPEISNIIINGNLVARYNLSISDKKNIIVKQEGIYIFNKISKTNTLPKFKMSNTNKLKLNLIFNNSMNRESIEKNLVIESLDKNITYSCNTESAMYIWENNDTKFNLTIPIKVFDSDIKYRLYFKEAFIDKNNNKAFNNEYFALQPISLRGSPETELSESIVFEILGSR